MKRPATYFLYTLLVAFLTACAAPTILTSYEEDGMFGYKNAKGKVVVEPQYEQVSSDWYWCHKQVQKNGKWGIMSSQGTMIIEPAYNYISYGPIEDLIMARKGSFFGYIDQQGKEVIPFIYDHTYGFQDGLAVVNRNNQWGVIDTTGAIVIPLEYEAINYGFFHEGLLPVRKNKKWGAIDKQNRMVIPFQYNQLGDFSEGLAIAAIDWTHWGYINHEDSAVIPFIYKNPHRCEPWPANFHNGLARVETKEGMGYINQQGAVVIPLKYGCIQAFHRGYAAVKQYEKPIDFLTGYKILQYGYVDSLGNETLWDYQAWDSYRPAITPAPSNLPDYSHLLGSKDTSLAQLWTLEKLLERGIQAFRREPVNYPNKDRLNSVCVAYGLMIGPNYGASFTYPNSAAWETFKQNTIFATLRSATLRQLAWEWIAPHYKAAFQSSNPVVQQAYRDMALYLQDYINHYDRRKVIKHLKSDPCGFAYNHPNGNKDEFRKLGALVDRLILIHGVISEKEARQMINTMADEVATW